MQAKPVQAMLDSLGENLIPRGASLPIEVAERLRTAIQDRDIIEGNNKLPSEAALAKAYGVSRPVIREAISLLKSDGLITSHQGRGQFVNPQGSNVFRLDPSMDTDEDLGELFEFLQSVEVPATRLAAQRRTPQDLAKIQDSYQRLYGATQESLDGADEDEDFHKSIICASHNQYFIAFANFLDTRVRRLIRIARKNTQNRSQELVWQVQSEHEAILRAIEAGDADQASLAASTHLKNAANRLALYKK